MGLTLHFINHVQQLGCKDLVQLFISEDYFRTFLTEEVYAVFFRLCSSRGLSEARQERQ